MTGVDVAERLGAAAAVFLEQMPAELVAESHALTALDPSALGVRVVYEQDGDRFALVWVGRLLGWVDGAYVRGEADP